jgi:hypothetical protein
MTDALISIMEKWYRCQGRFIVMYDHRRAEGRFVVSDMHSTHLFEGEFSTRALALEWCYNKRGKYDKPNS